MSDGRQSSEASNASKVCIRLSVGGVRLEFRGSRAFFERLIEPLVNAAYARSGAPEEQAAEASRRAEPEGPPAYRPASPLHFNQFVNQVGDRAADADQRIMAFAFYLWNFERKDEFGAAEISAFFRTVQDEPPEDLAVRLADLAERRRFMEAGGDDGAWRLTQKGVNYVKNRLLGPS
jgi:hypothetical protein